MKIYLIGALKNRNIIEIGNKIRELGHEVFDDWIATHPESDQLLWQYEKARGRTYREALNGYAAQNNFQFDMKHLRECDIAVLCLPAGKSGHMELGFVLGQGKLGFILLDKEPDRLDLMQAMASDIFPDLETLLDRLKCYILTNPQAEEDDIPF